ncbi:AMP-binding protein, partial [Aquisalimonas sp.]|uniref:AMP-binding enzyme n=1 Tax=Aquisalimonas sp. TaxID=1872621 RepID=UPI0025BEA153
ERVECLFTTPTELRMLQLAGNEPAARYDLSTLDRVFSTGEPLDPALHRWVRETLGTPPRDAWSQSETGVAMIAQYGDDPVTPGCMGRPTPGIEMALVTRSDDGVAPVGDGEVGQIALRAGWPSMFRAYLGDPARYRARFSGDWYLSGDTAQRDEAGELHFVGRLDDIIKTHGYMVGPAEVEAVLNRHPAIAESAVAGIPHAVAGTVVVAWVVLREEPRDPERLQRKLLAFAREALGTAVPPRHILFVSSLPKTPCGKLLRRQLVATMEPLQEDQFNGA